jgi:two-component system response regulator DegU
VTTPPPVPALAQLHIALLDDHRLFRQGIAFILHRLPYQVTIAEAATFKELLPLLAAQMPDVLLLDLQLPDVDGMEATKRLLERYPDLKIVVLSMHTDELMVAHMLKLGVRSYLPKDVDKELLQSAIAAVVSEGYYFTDSISKAMVRGLHSPAKALPSLGTSATMLTPRELEVLLLICRGKATNEIAQQLFISQRTVEGHRQKLLEKTNTTNAVGLVLYAVKHGLAPADVPH